MPIQRTLRVYPNPYAHTDHEGRPSGAFPYEPNLVHGDTHVRFVGATRVVTELTPARPSQGAAATHDHAWEFSPETVVLPDTDYYRRAIKSGELIAADAETWKAAGCADGFKLPREQLAVEKNKAVADYIAHYGEEPSKVLDHWDEFLGAQSQPTASKSGFIKPPASAPAPAPASAAAIKE